MFQFDVHLNTVRVLGLLSFYFKNVFTHLEKNIVNTHPYCIRNAIVFVSLPQSTLGEKSPFAPESVSYPASSFATRTCSRHFPFRSNYIACTIKDNIIAFVECYFIKSFNQNSIDYLNDFSFYRRLNDIAVVAEDQFYFTNFFYLNLDLEVLLGLQWGSIGFYDGTAGTILVSNLRVPNGLVLSTDHKSVEWYHYIIALSIFIQTIVVRPPEK